MDRMRPLVLVVDDRSPSRDLVRDELVEAGFDVVEAADGEAGWTVFLDHSCDLVVTDLRMPRLDGMGLLRRIRSTESPNAGVPVILLTAYGTLSLATAAGQAGATDCFPFNGSSVGDLIDRARGLVERRGETIPDELLGESAEARGIRTRLAALANMISPLLVSGEPGSGQSEAVTYLHGISHFAADPITRIKCGTGSDRDEMPASGIVVLENVDRLSAEGQKAWSERLGQIVRSGSDGDVRIVATTSAPLRQDDPRARSTFWRRLRQFEVAMPPLRARLEDLDLIVPRYLERSAQRLSRGAVTLGDAALTRLKSHGWPENFTEFRRAAEMLVAFSPGNSIGVETVAKVPAELDPVQRATRERERREREELLQLLHECGGNYTHMAQRLDVDRGTIKYRLRKYGIIPAGSTPRRR